MSEERELIFEAPGAVVDLELSGTRDGVEGAAGRVALVGGTAGTREGGAPLLDVDDDRGVKVAAALLPERGWSRPCNSFSASIAKWNKR